MICKRQKPHISLNTQNNNCRKWKFLFLKIRSLIIFGVSKIWNSDKKVKRWWKAITQLKSTCTWQQVSNMIRASPICECFRSRDGEGLNPLKDCCQWRTYNSLTIMSLNVENLWTVHNIQIQRIREKPLWNPILWSCALWGIKWQWEQTKFCSDTTASRWEHHQHHCLQWSLTCEESDMRSSMKCEVSGFGKSPHCVSIYILKSCSTSLRLHLKC